MGFGGVGAETLRAIMGKLAEFERMTVRECFGGRPGKDYEVAEIPEPKALERLETLGLADQTKIAVLRLTGRQRLYGFLAGAVFHVVWWDPDHKIWPSRLRHT